MVIKLKKRLFADTEPFVLRAASEENLLVLQAVDKGIFALNSDGLQIAQVVFERKNTALISVAECTDAMTIDANLKITSSLGTNYLVYGTPKSYTYDIFVDGALAATVAPKHDDADYYSINIIGGNFLKLIFVALALDKLILSPEK